MKREEGCEIAAGPERTIQPPSVSVLPMTFFWVILGLAVVAMLVVIARLVMKGGPPDQEPIVAEAEKKQA